MTLSFQPYNLTLPSYSPVWTYLPARDGSSATGWNSSYSSYSVGDAYNNQAAVQIPYARGVGVAYRATTAVGASVNLNFTGSAIYLCIASQGQATFTINGTQVDTTGSLPDDACATYSGNGSGTSLVNKLLVAENLPLGTHSANVQLEASGSLNMYGGTVTMNAGQIGPKKEIVIDDTDGGWNWDSTVWLLETDDPYMWDGSYRSGAAYGPNTVASYTFKGAYAIILKGLSMCNYGPYTVTLSGLSTRYNAFDRYWRHSPATTFFASGLDANQSYTLQVANYDSTQDPSYDAASAPCGYSSTGVDSLTLIVDDITTRDLLLSNTNSGPGSTGGSGASSNTGSDTSSSPSTSRPINEAAKLGIIGGVLGGALLLMAALVVYLVISQNRLRKRLRSMQSLTPSKGMDINGVDPVFPPRSDVASLPASSHVLTSPTISIPTSSPPLAPVGETPVPMGYTGGTITANNSARTDPSFALPGVTNPPRSGKQPIRALPIPPAHSTPPIQNEDNPLRGASSLSSPSDSAPIRRDSTRSRSPPALGDIVSSLSMLLNGHLRQEYLQREGVEEPPQYGTN